MNQLFSSELIAPDKVHVPIGANYQLICSAAKLTSKPTELKWLEVDSTRSGIHKIESHEASPDIFCQLTASLTILVYISPFN